MTTHTAPKPSLSLLRQWETLADEAIADAGYWKDQAKDLLSALELAASQFDFTVAAIDKGQTVSISSLQNCAANARAVIRNAKGVQS
jgi:non-ribosomal peptide synthetase component E (peptide arylation enzyme)